MKKSASIFESSPTIRSRLFPNLARIVCVSFFIFTVGSFAWVDNADAQYESTFSSDKRCVTCHRRLSFKQQPPAGDEWQVHVSANQFLQKPHAELNCAACHKDIEKTPHRKNIERDVDCVGCHRRHPEFILRDANGDPVLESELPLSNMNTCGHCHDTSFIAASSDHANAGVDQLYSEDRPNPWQAGPGFYGGWDPIRYDSEFLDDKGEVDPEAWLKRYGPQHVGGGPVSDLVDMNCLMCHSNITDHKARSEALEQGEFAWANSIPLIGKEILGSDDSGWRWNPEMFQRDGKLRIGLLDIKNPEIEKCGQCHGQASSDASTPLAIDCDDDCRRLTDRTGQIIAPHPISDSGINFVGIGQRDHPLDIHIDRGMNCANCHYLLNDPIYILNQNKEAPDHVVFDPRRPRQPEFLDRPMHQFAKGHSIHGLAAEESFNTLRGCEACHEVEKVHEWLPYTERHLDSLSCEACHIPKVFGPALRAIDWTFIDENGDPLRQYRGVQGDPTIAGAAIEGYQPVLLPRNSDGEHKLAPFNAVSSWFWVSGEPPRPVSREDLRAAMLVPGGHHPELVAALDQDGDGRLLGDELKLTTAEQQDLVRQRLAAIGLSSLAVKTEITPFSINHNVVAGKWSSRTCINCHNRDSRLRTEFLLSSYLPGGTALVSEGYAGVEYSGKLVTTAEGGVAGVPNPSLSGFYIVGHDAVQWIDWLGIALMLGTLTGVAIHTVLRIIAGRKRESQGLETKSMRKVYLYDVYERIWHWVQATMILYLIFTGLVIHNPHWFPSLSFETMVHNHNIFGWVLIINASLALFYQMASGRIKQYLPEPKDFFTRSLMQVAYYTRGIFRGESHPFEKTRRKRLNPLQEVTYFGILNVLLPLQIITGIMIWWGMVNWPILFNDLGGLPVLGPAHTLIAWVFASFIVMHVYLVTASGHTPMAATKSMITGWEHVERRRRKKSQRATESSEPGPES